MDKIIVGTPDVCGSTSWAFAGFPAAIKARTPGSSSNL